MNVRKKVLDPRHHNKPNTVCVICKKEIYVRPCAKIKHNCCSIACRNKWFSKDKHPRWKGGIRDVGKSRLKCHERKMRNKQHAIDYLGGNCCMCGYNKSPAAIDFHHVNPQEKSVTVKQLSACSLEKILREVDKCVLLCSNCHREYHYNQIHNHVEYNRASETIKQEHEKRTSRRTV